MSREEDYHRRQHGEAEGYPWCPLCQAFMEKDEVPNPYGPHKRHILHGVDHSHTCPRCFMLEEFLFMSQEHRENHARTLGWYQCGVCEGWYAREIPDDDHSAHTRGLFLQECVECQEWEKAAERLLRTLGQMLMPGNQPTPPVIEQ